MSVCKNIVFILFRKLLRVFDIRQDTTIIPKGLYCYEPDIRKNELKDRSDTTYYVKPCKYYRKLGKEYNGCSYLGVITNDVVFGDQCKLCDENID